jgi:hypothetical protein
MLDVAARGFARARWLAYLVSHRPGYVLGRFPAVRDVYSRFNWLKDLLGNARPLRVGELYGKATVEIGAMSSGLLIADKPATQQAAEMKAKAFSLGPQVRSEAVERLREAARTLPLEFDGKPIGTYGELKAAPERYDRIAIATVSNSSALADVRALAGDPVLCEAARWFLGYRPRTVSSWLFWSFANQLSDDERRAAYQTIDYHYDVDGFNFMYANFYLNDTTVRNGAHLLIEGSSRRKQWRHLVGVARLSDAQAYEAYGRDAERKFEGPAGFGFLEDASCYHKALRPLDGERLMLQLRYR